MERKGRKLRKTDIGKLRVFWVRSDLERERRRQREGKEVLLDEKNRWGKGKRYLKNPSRINSFSEGAFCRNCTMAHNNVYCSLKGWQGAGGCEARLWQGQLVQGWVVLQRNGKVTVQFAAYIRALKAMSSSFHLLHPFHTTWGWIAPQSQGAQLQCHITL